MTPKPTPQVRVSRKFREAVKLHPYLKQYEIAQAACVNPAQLSRMVRGRQLLRVNDPRALRIGEILGLNPSQVFEKNGH